MRPDALPARRLLSPCLCLYGRMRAGRAVLVAVRSGEERDIGGRLVRHREAAVGNRTETDRRLMQESLQLFPRHGAKLRDRVRPFRFRESRAVLLRVRQFANIVESAALRDCAVNSPFASGDVTSACTDIAPAESRDRNAARIAAECRDVVVNPLQGRNLVERSVITGGVSVGLLRQLRVRQNASTPTR